MSRTESTIIGIFLCLACPITFFVMGVLLYFELKIPEKTAVPSILAASVIGTILVISRLKYWVSTFYAPKKILTVPLFLFWCATALSLCMGLPLGVIAMGCMAALYIGRKAHHDNTETGLFEKDVKRTSLFTATVTGSVSLAMGLLAIQEQDTMQVILYIFGLQNLAATETGRTILVAIAVPLLTIVQYWLTYRLAFWAFRLGKKNRQKIDLIL
jgi:hypothetical protein